MTLNPVFVICFSFVSNREIIIKQFLLFCSGNMIKFLIKFVLNLLTTQGFFVQLWYLSEQRRAEETHDPHCTCVNETSCTSPTWFPISSLYIGQLG